MKAVTCTNAKLEVVDQPTPAAAKGQLLIDVLRCGICGSDLHARNHCDELADVMAETGYPRLHSARTSRSSSATSSAAKSRPRTRHPQVAARPARPSSPLPLVRRGKDVPHDRPIRPPPPAPTPNNSSSSSVPCADHPQRAAADKAALTEPMAVGWHAVRRSEITKKDVAIVIGCGPIGLAVILMLKAHGVRTVIASDYSPGRRALATRCAPTSWSTPRRTLPTPRPKATATSKPHPMCWASPSAPSKNCTSCRCRGGTSGAPPTPSVPATPKHLRHLRMRRSTRRHRRHHHGCATVLPRRRGRSLHGRRPVAAVDGD